jgi:hypothetical protein
MNRCSCINENGLKYAYRRKLSPFSNAWKRRRKKTSGDLAVCLCLSDSLLSERERERVKGKWVWSCSSIDSYVDDLVTTQIGIRISFSGIQQCILNNRTLLRVDSLIDFEQSWWDWESLVNDRCLFIVSIDWIVIQQWKSLLNIYDRMSISDAVQDKRTHREREREHMCVCVNVDDLSSYPMDDILVVYVRFTR